MDVRARFDALQQPGAALELLRRSLPAMPAIQRTVSHPHALRPDRFVLRVDALFDGGARRSYALKGYADDHGAGVFRVARALAATSILQGKRCPVCVPLAYMPAERLLISPWLEGRPLWDDIERGRWESMKEVAAGLSALHRSGVVPEAVTLPSSMAELIMLRCRRLYKKWPRAAGIIAPVMRAIEGATSRLDPAAPALGHGDPQPDHFLRTEDGWTLLDLDTYGYLDPTYDVGYFLAQLELKSMGHPARQERVRQAQEIFLQAYITVNPTVATANVAFYHAITIVRKCYTICLEYPEDWSHLLPPLTARALSLLAAMPQAEPVGSAHD